MDLREAAEKLRELADTFESAAAAIARPDFGGTDIYDAGRRLRAALGEDVYFAIIPPCVNFHASAVNIDKWCVYVEPKDANSKTGTSYKGGLLRDAVNAALAAHQETETTVTELQEALEPLPL